ncbi:MAG: ATP-dependent Clp protease ClpS [Bacteroidota bacterium]|jgi:ATP-dependent Clp protease adaptor protein ClpS|nr:ATP-dependent Clp protease ClpS [Bacteroidota bacterium]
MITNHFSDTEELLELDLLTKEEELNSIILYNDDVNTFEWVIECLMKYCGHDSIQAEQCAHIVHFSGKCAIKTGAFEKLKPICEMLLEKGLSVELN